MGRDGRSVKHPLGEEYRRRGDVMSFLDYFKSLKAPEQSLALGDIAITA